MAYTGFSGKIGICYFGIIRNVDAILPSLAENVVQPASQIGEIKVFCHLFRQTVVSNARSGENGEVDLSDALRLQADEMQWGEPDSFIETDQWERVIAAGDFYQDDNKSLRNLFHQLHSLKEVTSMALKDGCDMVIFARPDLLYLDSLGEDLELVLAQKRSRVATIPYWQSWYGLNDRFSIVKGEAAIRAYGLRAELIDEYLNATGRPLHAERLLKFALQTAGVSVIKVKTRAARVRVDGTAKVESFEPFAVNRAKKATKKIVSKMNQAFGTLRSFSV